LQLSPGVIPLVLSVLFFALMNVGVKLIPGIPAHEIVTFRALVTLVVGYVLLRIKHLSPWGNNKPLLLLRGLVGTCALVTYYYTLQMMPLTTAVTVQYLSPFFTLAISAALLREPPRPIQYPFFLLAFAGVALVKGFDPDVTLFELGVGVASALCSGIAYNLIRKLKQYDAALVVVFYFPLVTVPLVGSYTVTHFVTPRTYELVVLLLVGLATTIAQIFLTKAYQTDRASNISIFNYLGILFAIVFGVLLFHEIPRALALVGVALIVLGTVASTRYGTVREA